MIVRLTPEARRDLLAIGSYIARDNPGRSISFMRELRDKCRSLGDMPHAFPLAPRFAHNGIRRRRHGNYLIFYRIEPTRIVVLHIVHGARDYDAMFSGD